MAEAKGVQTVHDTNKSPTINAIHPFWVMLILPTNSMSVLSSKAVSSWCHLTLQVVERAGTTYSTIANGASRSTMIPNPV